MNRSRIAALVIAVVAAGCGSSPPPLPIITVTGKVTRASGPVAGANVAINGQKTTTAADGSFTIGNVPEPYSVLVGDVANQQALLYVGLRRKDPVLGAPITYSATVVSGALNDLSTWGANTAAAVAFGSSGYDVPLSTSSARAASGGAYAIPPACPTPPCIASPPVAWRGGASLSGTLHALQWEMDPATKLPTAYSRHGSRALTVAGGGSFTARDIAMTPVGTDVVAGIVSVPAGYTMSFRQIEAYFPPNTRIPLGSEGPPSQPAFAYQVPTGASATAAVWVSASKGEASSQVRQCGIPPGSQGPTAISLSMPLPPEPQAPADAAVAVTQGTAFSWTPFANGGVHTLFLAGDSTKPSLAVFTDGSRVELPDLTAVGMSWPASTAYQWYVMGFSPLTMDAWADPIIQAGCSFTSGSSAKRNFTTAP